MNAPIRPPEAAALAGIHAISAYADQAWDQRIVPALTDYIAGREGYDYNQHGKAGNTHASFVPDEIVERFCLLGSPNEHVAKLEALRDLGVHQFAGYLQHDNKEETLRQYGEWVIPAMGEVKVATW